MEIRELDEKDISSLIELYVELDGKNLDKENSLKVWREKIQDNKDIKYFGAVEMGKVVSTCYIMIIPNLTHDGAPIGFIENVVTSQNYRRQGLARKVLEAAIEYAKDRNCYKVILQSGAGRTSAHPLYESLGFNSTSKKAFDLRLK